jgi:hypothetical protein
MTYPPGGPGQQPWPGQPAQQPWPTPGQPPAQQAWPVPGQQSWPDQQQSWPSPAPGEQPSWPSPAPGEQWQVPGQQPWQGPPPGGAQTAGSAIASLICGLGAMFFLCAGTGLSVVGLGIVLAGLVGAVFAVGLGITAVVTGAAARRKIRTGAATGNGMAITGLILGIIAIVIVLILVAVLIFMIVRYG